MKIFAVYAILISTSLNKKAIYIHTFPGILLPQDRIACWCDGFSDRQISDRSPTLPSCYSSPFPSPAWHLCSA